jgi:hypothetical protein
MMPSGDQGIDADDQLSALGIQLLDLPGGSVGRDNRVAAQSAESSFGGCGFHCGWEAGRW